jgi:hypothetical protein
LNIEKPASLYASRVSFLTEFLFLYIDESNCQRDSTHSQPGNESDPVTIRTEIGERRHYISDWQTEDPRGNDRHDERHIDVFIAS